MPRKKLSRVPTRARPTVPDDSIIEPDMELEQKKAKLQLLLEDFDHEVQKRVELMEMETSSVVESICRLYKTGLVRYSEKTKNMLWKDYIKENNGENSSSVRNSIADVISSADNVLQSAAKKRGRKPKVLGCTGDAFLTPAAGTRSVRMNRQKAVLGVSQSDNLLAPPPTTSRVLRTKKLDVAATPANQGLPQSFSAMFVTPKFDMRNPLAPGTVRRRPRVGEIAMSFTGSPLQISPAINQKPEDVKEFIAAFPAADDEELDEETKNELKQFHKKIGQLIGFDIHT